ncbi:MAG: 3-hydroxybutyryl-CoA dehydrogenase [Bacteroidetes bacterium]|nr:3-hydroxybutyryl-CoA dehydrogenase [Bacteroidota bacterium]
MKMEIKTLAIAGGGTMGAGIAQVCAQAGYKAILFDINSDILVRAEESIQQGLKKMIELGKFTQEKVDETLKNLSFINDINLMKADLIIEAIVEKIDVKISLFQQLMELNGANTIYATNTSSIPITQIATKLKYPENVVGIHFFNPAQIMKLVEIIKGVKTDQKIVEIAYKFVLDIGKQPVISADAPGFIVNRIARLYYVESLKALEENVSNIETIDALLESSGFKMGPFKLMDLIGVDTNYSVTESQYHLFNHEARFRPSRIQKQKVDAGLHGKKTKEGFYKYN